MSRHNMSDEFRSTKHRDMSEFKAPIPRNHRLGKEVEHDIKMDSNHPPTHKQGRDFELALERSRNSKEYE